ncbi:MAG: 16S rRNA (guanine(966)-N(2))-methyltransferase RsmD [Anaerolineae bacterium]|jgi:16S rRNA (guanine(966)-N(2))-methyltransferase RsmD|nr:16S rRNA (guanine(966)-N(2))-methyltransferase RsmD [Anaerolineae bacterium]
MSLRVIAGSARGRKLKPVPGDSTRPIMDKVKEALFSIIGQSIVDSRFLDLFAGTGSVGIEALSRGAAQALFVEIDRKAIQTVRDNLIHTRLDGRAVIRMIDAFTLLRRPPDATYDYIFIAPPQYKGLWRQALAALENNPDWLRPQTQIIVQLDPTEWQAVSLTHMQEVDRRRYGKTLLLFYATVPPAPAPAPPDEE